jgi:hypothetical protein
MTRGLTVHVVALADVASTTTHCRDARHNRHDIVATAE